MVKISRYQNFFPTLDNDIQRDIYRRMMKLGAMCCHADIINYGSLPYTDFIRTKTLCQGGDCSDFLFVRRDTEEFERTKSI